MAGPEVGALIGREVLEAYKHRAELVHGEDAGRGREAQDLPYLILCCQPPQENPQSPMEEPLEPWDTKVSREFVHREERGKIRGQFTSHQPGLE